jgi:hypothetical protein
VGLEVAELAGEAIAGSDGRGWATEEVLAVDGPEEAGECGRRKGR